MNPVRKIYDWVLGLAQSPYGSFWLILLAIAESSFFPIPPDVLLIALCLGNQKKSWTFGLICSLGSVIGGVAGYAIGHFMWWSGAEFSGFAQWFFDYIPGFKEAKFFEVKELYEKFNFWIVFAAGFTPIPYKIITISAGAFSVDFAMFLIASMVGRSARFILVSGLLYFFGYPIKNWIDKYFNWLAIIFTLLLVGGFWLIKLL